MSKKEYPTTTPDWQAAAKRRTRFYLVTSVLLAILFGVLVFQFFSQLQQAAPGVLTSAVFASRNIKEGALLTEEMLEVRKVPVNALPEPHFVIKEQVLGKSSRFPLVEGEVILPEKLASGQGSFLAQRCPVGKWCVSIPAAWFIAAPPDLAVGDRVEIASALHGNHPDETGFIASGVQVMALPGGLEDPAYVFAVMDTEALSLLYARTNGFQLLVLLRPAGI